MFHFLDFVEIWVSRNPAWTLLMVLSRKWNIQARYFSRKLLVVMEPEVWTSTSIEINIQNQEMNLTVAKLCCHIHISIQIEISISRWRWLVCFHSVNTTGFLVKYRPFVFHFLDFVQKSCQGKPGPRLSFLGCCQENQENETQRSIFQ